MQRLQILASSGLLALGLALGLAFTIAGGDAAERPASTPAQHSAAEIAKLGVIPPNDSVSVPVGTLDRRSEAKAYGAEVATLTAVGIAAMYGEECPILLTAALTA